MMGLCQGNHLLTVPMEGNINKGNKFATNLLLQTCVDSV